MNKHIWESVLIYITYNVVGLDMGEFYKHQPL